MKYINRFVQNDMYHKIENLVSKNSIEVKRKILDTRNFSKFNVYKFLKLV